MIGDPKRFAMLPFDNVEAYADDVLSVVGLSGHATAPINRGTAFIGVLSGTILVTRRRASHRLQAGWYGCIPSPARIEAQNGRALVVTIKGYAGLFSVGGPIEQQGRLQYIDGCTDTGIVMPPKQGDPCLNCLFFPAGTKQTAHTHPSHRVGLIVDGRGWCLTDGRKVEMKPGSIFMIPTDVLHAFTTDKEAMRIIVCHPDSEVGPTDEVHQMLTATIIAEPGVR